MASISERRQSDDLYESILTLKDLESCKRFFNVLCSPTERRAMEQRFEVARLLQAGTSYMDILEKTGVGAFSWHVTIRRKSTNFFILPVHV